MLNTKVESFRRYRKISNKLVHIQIEQASIEGRRIIGKFCVSYPRKHNPNVKLTLDFAAFSYDDLPNVIEDAKRKTAEIFRNIADTLEES